MCPGLFIQWVPGLKEEEKYLEGDGFLVIFLITDLLHANFCLRCEREETFYNAEMRKELSLLNIKLKYNCVSSEGRLPRKEDSGKVWAGCHTRREANGRRQGPLTLLYSLRLELLHLKPWQALDKGGQRISWAGVSLDSSSPSNRESKSESCPAGPWPAWRKAAALLSSFCLISKKKFFY